MLIYGLLLANRLNGGRLLASGVQSDSLLIVAPMMIVLYCSLNMVCLGLVLRGRPVGVARVVHPLGCTRGRGRHCRMGGGDQILDEEREKAHDRKNVLADTPTIEVENEIVEISLVV